MTAQFFRGVATVCTKLFNAVQPDHAYFGQKDIQQALLLKISTYAFSHPSQLKLLDYLSPPYDSLLTCSTSLSGGRTVLAVVLKDLLSAHPTSENLHIIPTTRDSKDNLALSSRNAYLTPSERVYAPTLHRALTLVENALVRPESSEHSSASTSAEEAIAAARGLIESIAKEAKAKDGVEIKFDYIEVFDRDTFEVIRGGGGLGGREGVVAGAMWVGKTRLIDNLLLGWEV